MNTKHVSVALACLVLGFLLVNSVHSFLPALRPPQPTSAHAAVALEAQIQAMNVEIAQLQALIREKTSQSAASTSRAVSQSE